MELKFHQKTFDLLTKTRIDPQKVVDAFEDERAFTYTHYTEAEGPEYVRQRIQDWRDTVLPWTELDLYRRPIRFSDKNIRKLNELEQRYNVQLPASVREWYSLDIAPEIMSVWDVGGYPPTYRKIEDLGPISRDTCYSYHVAYRNDLWHFLDAEYIEQGGEELVFQVGPEDDPPVFALLHREYRLLEPSFSQFIFLHFWDWLARYAYTESILIRPYELLGSTSQYWLPVQRFQERLSELRFHSGRYFFDDDLRISVYMAQSSDGSNAHSDLIAGGRFRTTNLLKLRQLIIDLWGEYQAPAFYMVANGDEVSSVVDELQRKQLLHLIASAPSDWVSLEYLVDQLSSPDTIPPHGFLLANRIKRQVKKLNALIELDEPGAENDQSLAVRYRLRP